jgi:glycosyltransferase involved in cell wall biosynthesis
LNIVSQPLVSVVTPFHNTAAYLAECIESILAQTYSNFEYLLVDNCSTDGSTEIAERYTRSDPRIRLIRRPRLLSQVQNYNGALTEISRVSRYCKIVQADDFIFPDCLHLMVQAFERSESVGLVSAYDLKGGVVRGSGVPYQAAPYSGKDIAKLYLRDSVFPFGSPTTVMYRSSLIRDQQPFYDESLLHEDTEKCMQILEDWNFAFVHQVLSFLRVGNESISSAARSFQPDRLDRYILVQRYAAKFLPQEEAIALKALARHEYYSFLSEAAFRRRETEFWKYHQMGLKTLNEQIDWRFLALQMGREMLGMAANPGLTSLRLYNWFRVRYRKQQVDPNNTRASVIPYKVPAPASGHSSDEGVSSNA